MQATELAPDRTYSLRREINAISGLLQFSIERRYPEALRQALQRMMGERLAELEASPTAPVGFSV